MGAVDPACRIFIYDPKPRVGWPRRRREPDAAGSLSLCRRVRREGRLQWDDHAAEIIVCRLREGLGNRCPAPPEKHLDRRRKTY